MKTSFVFGAILASATLATSVPLAAQTAVGNPAQALAEARQRLVCGTGTVVDATYLTGGLLQATCRAQQSPRTLPSELQGTALTAGQAAAAAAAALLLVVVATGGGDDNSSTTTTYKYSD